MLFYLYIIIISLLVLTSGGLFQSSAKLTLNKECGDVVCKEHTYCSPTDHICRPCDNICNPKLGNHDANRCEEDCQDFLHDELYARKAVNTAVDSVQNELWILKILVGLTLSMTSLVFIILVVLTFKISLRRRNNKKAKAVELPAIIYNNKQYEKTVSTPVQRPSDNNNDNLRREPSESTLPEYSYDNPSMIISPSHHV